MKTKIRRLSLQTVIDSFLGPARSVLRVFLLCALWNSVPQADAKDSATTEHASSMEDDAMLDIVLTDAARLREFLADASDWDTRVFVKNTGAMARLEAKAERFLAERELRQKLQAASESLVKSLEAWEARKKEGEHQHTIRALRARLAALEDRGTVDIAGVTENTDSAAARPLDSFSYFEVTSDATLKEISALPETYTDASLWRVIYNANADKLEAPDEIVPKSTVLVIPHIKIARDFEFD